MKLWEIQLWERDALDFADEGEHICYCESEEWADKNHGCTCFSLSQDSPQASYHPRSEDLERSKRALHRSTEYGMNHPKQDWNGDKLIVELDVDEVETLELLLERLDVLLKIENAMESVAMTSPFITGTDLPHITGKARKLVHDIIAPWTPEPGTEFVIYDAGTQ